jgi:hypothetical protein
MTVNFVLKSEFQTVHRRSFEMADPDILKPIPGGGKVPLVDGEWLQLNTSYQMERGTANPYLLPSYPYIAEQGRYETQAIGKGPILYGGFFEADTLIMDGTGLAVGDALEIQDVAIATLTRRALIEFTTGYIVGRVTRLPANNNNYLRFIRVDNG